MKTKLDFPPIAAVPITPDDNSLPSMCLGQKLWNLPRPSFSHSLHASYSKIQWPSSHSESRTWAPSHCFPPARWSNPPSSLTRASARVPRPARCLLPCPPSTCVQQSSQCACPDPAQNPLAAPMSLRVRAHDQEAHRDQPLPSLPLPPTMALNTVASLKLASFLFFNHKGLGTCCALRIGFSSPR